MKGLICMTKLLLTHLSLIYLLSTQTYYYLTITRSLAKILRLGDFLDNKCVMMMQYKI